MSALPRCAPPLGSTQAGQVAEQQHLQQVQGTGVHVHQASAEPAAHARLTLDDLAAGYRPAELLHSSVRVVSPGYSCLVRVFTRQLAPRRCQHQPGCLWVPWHHRQQPHSALAQTSVDSAANGHISEPGYSSSAPSEHHCCCPYLPGYPQAIHI